jgi:hypothetical protein
MTFHPQLVATIWKVTDPRYNLIKDKGRNKPVWMMFAAINLLSIYLASPLGLYTKKGGSQMRPAFFNEYYLVFIASQLCSSQLLC